MSKEPDLPDGLDPEDDLAEWADDPFVRALRAPGSSSELGEEEEYAAAFRAEGPRARVVPLPRRLAGRLGAGGAVIAAVALTGGVAAALTGNLPEPVQQIAHSVLGAPAPEPEDPSRAPRPAESSPAGSPSGTASAAVTPSGRPSRSSAPGRGAEATAPPGPGASATDSASPEPSESPSTGQSAEPTPVPVTVSAVSMTSSAHLTPYGGSLTLGGQATTAAGEPAAGVPVALLANTGSGWHRLARVTSDDSGAVSASTGPITGRARYRWRTRPHVLSGTWRVKVQATLTGSSTSTDTTTVITADPVGAAPGDAVQLITRVRRQPTVVATTTVDSSGRASFEFPTPKRRHAFVVHLVATRDHTGARARVTVTPPARPVASPSADG